MAFLVEKFFNVKDSLVKSFNESLEKYEQEVCRHKEPCPHKKNLPRFIRPYSHGIYPDSEFSSTPIIVYQDICLKGVGKYCEGPEKELDINFLFETEENIVEF